MKLSLFKSKAPKEKISVGLDIGTSQIKAVKLKSTKDSLEFIGFAQEPVIQQDVLIPLKKISEAQGINSANIAVSGPAVIIRYLNLTQMTPEELKQSLKFEVEKYIPFSAAEVNTDACIIRSGLPDNKMLVLLAAVKKDFLNQRLKLMQEAGLKVNSVDIDSLAMINAFDFNYSQEEKTKVVGLLNIGASFSNLNILESGAPVLSRDMQIGGNNLTQKIADIMGIDLKTAENLKINPDKNASAKITSAIDAVLSNLAAEIRTSFDYYESQHASSVDRIILSGGASLSSGLKESLANFLGIGVEYWDPLKKINTAQGVDTSAIKSSSAKFSTAVGLALHA